MLIQESQINVKIATAIRTKTKVMVPLTGRLQVAGEGQGRLLGGSEN